MVRRLTIGEYIQWIMEPRNNCLSTVSLPFPTLSPKPHFYRLQEMFISEQKGKEEEEREGREESKEEEIEGGKPKRACRALPEYKIPSMSPVSCLKKGFSLLGFL